jgi:hypothetical protein
MAAGQSRSSNVLVVPQADAALDQLKYEVAQELGIQIPQDGYMATNGGSTLRGDEESACARKLDNSQLSRKAPVESTSNVTRNHVTYARAG